MSFLPETPARANLSHAENLNFHPVTFESSSLCPLRSHSFLSLLSFGLNQSIGDGVARMMDVSLNVGGSVRDRDISRISFNHFRSL